MSEASTVTLIPTRKRGVGALLERFPEAVELWNGTIRTGSGQKFTITAFTISGYVVLVQQHGKDAAYAWDLFVTASNAPEIGKTLDAVAAIVAGEGAPRWEVRVRA